MKVTFQKKIVNNPDFFIFLFEEGKTDQKRIKEFCGTKKDVPFEGKIKECLRVLHPELPHEVYLFGLGNLKMTDGLWKEMRSTFFKTKHFLKGVVNIICDNLTERQVYQISLGMALAYKKLVTYKVENGTNGHSEPEIVFTVKNEVAIESGNKALLLSDTQESVMTWIDTPSNIKTPAFMVDKAKNSAKKYGFSCKVLDKDALQKQGMFSLLAVGQGSANPPAMLVLEYKPQLQKAKKIGLVGKGITFDTGGISIKPSTNMGFMKSDMSGAAAMLGCIELVAKRKLPVHLVVVLPLAENSVDANSIRPGDVISSYSGKSIEVIDTDAEGRLVLADGLSYIIKNYNPDVVIDMATLTGNVVQSLGNYASGLFTNNEELAEALLSAGQQSDEKLWQLPLWDEYKQDMLSDIADIKNLGSKPMAGSVTAAKFLEFFTEGHTAWAHIDIAGVAFTDSEYAKSRTATAFGVHLLCQFIENWLEKK
ncbi:MAG: leucyl aminopeptidase family protein [Saprospiraceae bacterium]|nr:leucyl aminopeptidase family protein [Saprospiraceae bacterium]